MDLILWEILFYRVTPCPPDFKKSNTKRQDLEKRIGVEQMN